MKAIIIREHGGLDKLLYEEVPTPEPGPGEVLLRVKACALNHLDLFARQGLKGPGLRPRHLPHISGVDVAGVVERLGPGVDGWAVGDAAVVYSGLTCGRCEFCRIGEDSMCAHYRIWGEHCDGGQAEFAVVPASALERMPPGASFVETAAVPAAYTTAWRMVISTGGVRPGETVLVLGVGGGVGTAALQLARLAGARVMATAGHDWKLERARELGAEAVCNHSSGDFEAAVMEWTGGRGVDLVVNPVGGETWRKGIRSLATGGRMTLCGATAGDNPDFSIREIYQRHRRILGAPLGNRGEFRRVLGLVWSGALKPVIHKVYPLSEARAAHAEMEERRQFGKVVLTP